MTNRQPLAEHEALDLHELLNLRTLNLAKSKFMQGIVFDSELKSLMEKDVRQSVQAIGRLQALYAEAPFRAPVPELRPTPILN